MSVSRSWLPLKALQVSVSRSIVLQYCIRCLLFPVLPSLETVTTERKSLIQLIHLRPSSPPLFICPFSAFSPYIHPSIPPLLSLRLSLSLSLSTSPTDQLLFLSSNRGGPAHPTPPLQVPQVNQRRPGHTLGRKGPGSPYGLAEKGSF